MDTNVWLFIYGPQKPGNTKESIYSGVLAKILTAGSKIFIDVLIVSEFINTYARLKWNVMGKPRGDFKSFRKSVDFKPIAQDIAADVKQILKHCLRIESGFDALAIIDLLDEYALGKADFNDQVIATLCREKGLILVTDDGDFRDNEIPIVTANRRLLAS
ncbi:MAG: PIN domain-containing protein [Betaproteobacteria bacterium]|nr:PIN domain-containing protein [Betaproteobacteria bacterium]